MIQLLPLTQEEQNFLAHGKSSRSQPQERLTRALAAWLSARLRLPLQAQGMTASALRRAVDTPQWRREPLLDSLWLTRRLGGRQVRGGAAAEQAGLTRTLDQLLAETWLDAPQEFSRPQALSWQIAWEGQSAVLELDLPDAAVMKRWAMGVIRAVE